MLPLFPVDMNYHITLTALSTPLLATGSCQPAKVLGSWCPTACFLYCLYGTHGMNRGNIFLIHHHTDLDKPIILDYTNFIHYTQLLIVHIFLSITIVYTINMSWKDNITLFKFHLNFHYFPTLNYYHTTYVYEKHCFNCKSKIYYA